MGSILATLKEENNLPRDLLADPGEEGQFFPYEVVHSEAAMAAHRETLIFRPKSRQSLQSWPQQTTSRLNLSRPAARPQTPDPAPPAEYSGPAQPAPGKTLSRPGGAVQSPNPGNCGRQTMSLAAFQRAVRVEDTSIIKRPPAEALPGCGQPEKAHEGRITDARHHLPAAGPARDLTAVFPRPQSESTPCEGAGILPLTADDDTGTKRQSPSLRLRASGCVTARAESTPYRGDHTKPGPGARSQYPAPTPSPDGRAPRPHRQQPPAQYRSAPGQHRVSRKWPPSTRLPPLSPPRPFPPATIRRCRFDARPGCNR